MPLDERTIEAITQRVLAALKEREGRTVTGASQVRKEEGPPPHLSHVGRVGREIAPPVVSGEDGIYPDVDSAVRAARVAYQKLNRLSLAARKRIIQAIRDVSLQNAELLARMAHEETGLGRVEDKVKKNELVATKTPGPEILEPVAWSGDDGLTLTEWAPYGVVAAITPITNPTATVINNAISIISAGNAVVFNVHPGAKQVNTFQIQLLNRAIPSGRGTAGLDHRVRGPHHRDGTGTYASSRCAVIAGYRWAGGGARGHALG